ncbi:MAG: ABC transporter permease [Thermoanaerobaculales bacterium]|jgi:lipopolysaccharide transport system permease protein|nr:ABC transporter permease [Thermoanaerobaculales bacterium]
MTGPKDLDQFVNDRKMVARPATVIVVEPQRGLMKIGFEEIFDFRELLFFLVWRDIKVRYKQTIIGVSWAILQPLLTMVVFTAVFGRLADLQGSGVPYAVFSLAGILPWTFFAQGFGQSSNSLVGSSHLITKVYFPRILIPTAAVLAGLVDLTISFLVLVGILAIFNIQLTLNALWLPVILVFIFVTTLAAGTWLSALNVRYRDVRYIVPFVVQIGMFVSPVIYSAQAMTAKLEAVGIPGWVYGLNPMVGVIESFRWTVLGAGEFPGSLVAVGGVVSLLGFFLGLVYFRQMERSFADVV